MAHRGKLILATGLLGAAVLANGYNFMPKDTLPSPEEFSMERVETLELNLDDNKTTYAVRTIREATDDMMTLVKNDILEEGWAEARGKQQSQFYEIGRNNWWFKNEKEEQTGINLDINIIHELMRGQKELHFWHDHPQITIEKILEYERRYGERPAAARIAYSRVSSRGALPDKYDLATMLAFSYEHQQVYWNTSFLPWSTPKQEHHIRSEHGVATFALTSAGKNHYFSLAEKKGLARMKEQGSEELDGALQEFLEPLDPQTIIAGKQIEEYVANWHHPYLYLTFTPNENIGTEYGFFERMGLWFDKTFSE